MSPRRAITTAIVLLLLASCAWIQSASVAISAPTAPPTAPAPSLTITFAGDVNFAGPASELLSDPATAFGPIAGMFAGSDLTLLTLNTTNPHTSHPAGAPGTRTDPRTVLALRAAGVDAVTLASDHAPKQGRESLAQTMAVARAGALPVFGAGKNAAAAYRPWRTTVRGLRVAVLGLNQIEDPSDVWAAGDHRVGLASALDQQRSLAAVAAARRSSDLVIVMPHWGRDHGTCLTLAQRDFAAELGAAGADVIVGTHADAVQATGSAARTFIAFGLGTLIGADATAVGADPAPAPTSARGAVLKLSWSRGRVISPELIPLNASASGRPARAAAQAPVVAPVRLEEPPTCSELPGSWEPPLPE